MSGCVDAGAICKIAVELECAAPADHRNARTPRMTQDTYAPEMQCVNAVNETAITREEKKGDVRLRTHLEASLLFTQYHFVL